MGATVAGLNIAGWGCRPRNSAVTTTSARRRFFGVGTGALAYTLGMRHAFDADHC